MSTKLAAAAGYVICSGLAVLLGWPVLNDAIHNPGAALYVIAFLAVVFGIWHLGQWLIDRPKAAEREARLARHNAEMAKLDEQGRDLDAELAKMRAERPAVLRQDADDCDTLAKSLIDGGLNPEHPYLLELWGTAHGYRATAAELEAELGADA